MTVVATSHGRSRVDSMTLLLNSGARSPEDVVANAARLVAQRAIYGQLAPTPKKEGGRG